MPTTTDTAATLPTGAEVEEARKALADAVEAISDLKSRVRRITKAEYEGDGTDLTPTLEDIGRAYLLVWHAKSYLKEGREYADELDDMLADLAGMTDIGRELP